MLLSLQRIIQLEESLTCFLELCGYFPQFTFLILKHFIREGFILKKDKMMDGHFHLGQESVRRTPPKVKIFLMHFYII